MLPPPVSCSAREALALLIAVFWLMVPSVALAARPDGAPDRDATVNQSTGAAEIQILIEVPRDTGGFQPNLTLRYSSQAGDGVFGIGWSLALGDISRSERFGFPGYTENDTFELDGELLVRSQSDPSRYHTIVEKFWRIRRVLSSNSWEVTFPNGHKARYGLDRDSRVCRDESCIGTTARWLISEMEDVNGNVIRFSYARFPSTDPGVSYLSTITYSYRNGSLVGSVERRVQLVYETRPDTVVAFSLGVRTVITQRVEEIGSYVDGQVHQRRILRYGPPPGGFGALRSRLTSTQVFGTNCTSAAPESICDGLPAQTIMYTELYDPESTTDTVSTQWDGGASGFPELSEDQPSGYAPGRDLGVRFGDITGDVPRAVAYLVLGNLLRGAP